MGVALGGAGDWRRDRRASWLFVLGLSALLHLPLLYLLGKGLTIHPWSSPVAALRVDLLPAVSERSESATVRTAEGGSRSGNAAVAERQDAASAVPRPTVPSPAAPSSTVPSPTVPAPSAGFDSRHAVEAALDVAREVGRGTGEFQRRTSPVPSANLRAVAPAATKPSTLDLPQPGETRYADGRMKTVDQWGRASCIKEPADFVYGQHGEVIPRMAIRTNCP